MKTRHRVIFLGLLFGSLTFSTPTNSTPAKPGDLRTPGRWISQCPAARRYSPISFARVALLHSFFYEEARRIFTGIAEKDPNCAMAQWGIAMTWWHPIWTPPRPDEMSAGKAAVAKAMAMKSGSDRERRFITALIAYYNTPDGAPAAVTGQSCHGPVGPRDRVVAYEKAMRELYDGIPTILKRASSTPSRSWPLGMPRRLTRLCRTNCKRLRFWKNSGRRTAIIPGAAHYLIH